MNRISWGRLGPRESDSRLLRGVVGDMDFSRQSRGRWARNSRVPVNRWLGDWLRQGHCRLRHNACGDRGNRNNTSRVLIYRRLRCHILDGSSVLLVVRNNGRLVLIVRNTRSVIDGRRACVVVDNGRGLLILWCGAGGHLVRVVRASRVRSSRVRGSRARGSRVRSGRLAWRWGHSVGAIAVEWQVTQALGELGGAGSTVRIWLATADVVRSIAHRFLAARGSRSRFDGRRRSDESQRAACLNAARSVGIGMSWVA